MNVSRANPDLAQSIIIAQAQKAVRGDASRDGPLSEFTLEKIATIVDLLAMRKIRLGIPFDSVDLHFEAMTTVAAMVRESVG